MNKMQGAFFLAKANMSLTFRGQNAITHTLILILKQPDVQPAAGTHPGRAYAHEHLQEL